MNQDRTPFDHDDQHVRELFRRAGADPLGLAPSTEARRHAEQVQVRRRAGAAAVAVAAVVGAAALVTWPRAGEAAPAITPSPTVTSAPTTSAPTTSAPTTSAPTTAAPTTSAPTTAAPTTSTPAVLAPGLPVLPTMQDPFLEKLDRRESSRPHWALSRCGLPSGDPGNPPIPPDAVDVSQWEASGAESGLYEDVVLLPDERAATTQMQTLRAAYATCAPPDGSGDDMVTRTTEVADVGDDAFMVVVDWPSMPMSYYAVVVRVGATVAMYSYLGLPSQGPKNFVDSGLVAGLTVEFVVAASAR